MRNMMTTLPISRNLSLARSKQCLSLHYDVLMTSQKTIPPKFLWGTNEVYWAFTQHVVEGYLTGVWAALKQPQLEYFHPFTVDDGFLVTVEMEPTSANDLQPICSSTSHTPAHTTINSCSRIAYKWLGRAARISSEVLGPHSARKCQQSTGRIVRVSSKQAHLT